MACWAALSSGARTCPPVCTIATFSPCTRPCRRRLGGLPTATFSISASTPWLSPAPASRLLSVGCRVAVISRVEYRQTVLEFHFVTRQQRQGFGIELVFHCQHPVRQGLRRVVRMHRHICLRNDGAGIQLLHYEMHTGAAQRFLGFDHPLMNPGAAIIRQQGGMNVDQPAFPATYESVRKDAHEAG